MCQFILFHSDSYGSPRQNNILFKEYILYHLLQPSISVMRYPTEYLIIDEPTQLAAKARRIRGT